MTSCEVNMLHHSVKSFSNRRASMPKIGGFSAISKPLGPVFSVTIAHVHCEQTSSLLAPLDKGL